MKTFINFAKAKPFNLQIFADDPASAEPTPTSTTEPKSADPKPQEPTQEPQAKPKYTDDDVNRIINKKYAEWSEKKDKEIEEAKTEAQKLAKMNAEQKKQYEFEKAQQKNAELQAQIEALKKEALKADLAKEAATTLQTDHNITATQDILDFVVGETAEETNERIQKFVAIIQADRKAVEVERATGHTPKNYNKDPEEKDVFAKKLAKYRR